MDRKEWNAEYAKHFVESGAVDQDLAGELAEAATDEFNDGMTPKEAVDSELSYWAEG